MQIDCIIKQQHGFEMETWPATCIGSLNAAKCLNSFWHTRRKKKEKSIGSFVLISGMANENNCTMHPHRSFELGFEQMYRFAHGIIDSFMAEFNTVYAMGQQ